MSEQLVKAKEYFNRRTIKIPYRISIFRLITVSSRCTIPQVSIFNFGIRSLDQLLPFFKNINQFARMNRQLRRK